MVDQGVTFHRSTFRQVKIFHNRPTNFSKIFWFHPRSLTYGRPQILTYHIKRMSFEKNVVEYNLQTISPNRMSISGGLGCNISQINFQQVKIFHNKPRNFLKIFWFHPRSLTYGRPQILTYHTKRMSFEKNVVEYNLQTIKLSSEKVLV